MPPTKPASHIALAEHDALPAGTRFGELEIVRVLGVGGFGIVYLARDHSLEREVALKEYMPASLATRGEGPQITVRSGSFAETYAVGLRSFINEARLLAKFDHPSLVKVYRFWEANGTAYMVMPYLQGRTLRDARKAMSQAPDEAWMRGVLYPILGALEVLHREGVFHRDIAPDNILIPLEGPAILLDFGAARRVISDRTQSLTAILKPSYAPIEQYAEMSALRQGPWTDLYALGAVAHFLLQGAPPGPATARALQDEMVPLWMRHYSGVSPRFLASIDWALQVRPKERPQSVEELRAALDGRIEPPAIERHDTVGSASAPAPLDQGGEPTQFEATRRVNGPGITTSFEPTMRVAPPQPTRTQAAPPPVTTARTAAAPVTQVAAAQRTVVSPTVATVATQATATPLPAAARTLAAPVTIAPARAAAPAPAPQKSSSTLRIVIAAAAVVLGLAAGAAARHFGFFGSKAAPVAAATETPAAAPVQAAETPAPVAAPTTESAAPAAAAPVTEVASEPVTAAPASAEPPPVQKPAVVREARKPAADPGDGALRPLAPAPETRANETVSAAPAAAEVKPRAAPVARDPAPAPVAKAPDPVPAGPATAREACGSRMLFALSFCMNRECKKPQYSGQPDCVAIEEQRRARDRQ